MWCYRILGVLLLINVPVKAASYTVSCDKTEWRYVQCNLTEPQLTYENGSFQVNEALNSFSTDSDIWIGYIWANVPFLFLGCGKVQTETTHGTTHIGYCYSLCGDGIFAINPWGCRCTNQSLGTMLLSGCRRKGSTLCNNNNTMCYALYTYINVNSSEENLAFVKNTPGDCLVYYYPYFVWSLCNREDPIQTMCSEGSFTHISPKATTIENQTYDWVNGNAICINRGMYPAFPSSIVNAKFTEAQKQYYWTGIIRTDALIKKSAIGTSYTDQKYAFLETSDLTLNFTHKGAKKALCVPGTETPCTTVSSDSQKPTIIKDTEGTRQGTTIKPNASSAVGAGVGVSVGVLVTVVVAVVIIVLRKRGIIPYCMNKTSCEKDDVNPDGTSSNDASVDNSVAKHNFFALEKCTISEDEPLDHYNTPGDPNEVIVEEDNYNSITDTDEPRGHVQGDNSDYDYTTNEATQSPANPDNVYNKLKLDRHGDYDQVHGQGTESRDAQENGDYDHVHGQRQMHNIKTSNAYDTTAALASKARDAQGNGDYDHVKGLSHKHNITISNDYNTTTALASNVKVAHGNGD